MTSWDCPAQSVVRPDSERSVQRRDFRRKRRLGNKDQRGLGVHVFRPRQCQPLRFEGVDFLDGGGEKDIDRRALLNLIAQGLRWAPHHSHVHVALLFFKQWQNDASGYPSDY